MILAARETLGGHTNSGLLPRALAELILAAREPAPMGVSAPAPRVADSSMWRRGGAGGSKGTGALGVTPHGSRHDVPYFSFFRNRRLNFTPSLNK